MCGAQVTDVFEAAQSLGLTVIRTWAFNDGMNYSFPLQPLQGQLNATIFRYSTYIHKASSAKSGSSQSVVQNHSTEPLTHTCWHGDVC